MGIHSLVEKIQDSFLVGVSSVLLVAVFAVVFLGEKGHFVGNYKKPR